MARWHSHALGARVHALIAALLCLGTLVVSSAPAAAAPTTVAVAQATSGTLSGWMVQSIADPSAAAGSAVKYGWSGTVQLNVSIPADADGVTLRVRGDQCAGAPAYTLTIDGAQVASDTVSSTSWTTVASPVSLVAGTHVIQVAFTNPGTQYVPTACSRVLYLDTVSFTSSAPLATPPPIPAGYVHQSGIGLLDGAGHPIRLRGVNVGGWLEWQGWEWGEGFDYIGESAMMDNLSSLVGTTQADQFRTAVYDNYITTADLHAMAVDGLNVVRVPFNYRMLEDDANPFVYKQSGWDVLDRLVSEAKQANIYLILDMSVAPCSQMYAFISDYVGGPDLWSSFQCQDRMVALWKAVAARYANSNVIAGYDVLNETIIGDGQLLSLYQRVTAAIRSVDPNHMLIYEGNDMARTFTLFSAPLDPNEMLSVHDYPWAFPGQDVSVRMAAWDAAARALNVPIYVGEFGQSSYADDTEYVTNFNNDPNIAAWTEWTWKQAPGYPALQNIQESAAARKLIDWMNNTTRPQPTAAEASQGMSDFINEIRFQNTLPDAQLRAILDAPGPPATAAAPGGAKSTGGAKPTTGTTKTKAPTSVAVAPGRRAKVPEGSRCTRVSGHAKKHPRKKAGKHVRKHVQKLVRKPHRTTRRTKKRAPRCTLSRPRKRRR
jgi:aryl-phospho-beta-D-glucosidase BglC (GH1 family)